MKLAREIPLRQLPAPTAGMYRAKRPTGIIVALLILLLAMVIGSIPAVIEEVSAQLAAAELGETDTTLAPYDLTGWSGFFSFVALGGVIVLWVLRKERRSLASLGFAWRAGTPNPAGTLAHPQTTRTVGPQIVQGGALALAMMMFCVLVPVMTGDAVLRWRAPELSTSGLLIVVGMVFWFLFQGSAEEVVTRGYLTQVFARRWGLITAIVAQAVIFSAMHGANPGMGVLPAVNLILFAVFASLVTLAYGSLWSMCAFHGVWNWAQGNLFGVAVSGNTLDNSLFAFTPTSASSDLLTGGAFGIEGSVLCTAMYACGAVIAVVSSRHQRARAAQATVR